MACGRLVFFEKKHSRSIKLDTVIKYASSLTGIDLVVNMCPRFYPKPELLNFISRPLSEITAKFATNVTKVENAKLIITKTHFSCI